MLEDTDAPDASRFPAWTVELVELLTDPMQATGRPERRNHCARLWTDRDATVLKSCDRLDNPADSLLATVAGGGGAAV